MTFIPAMNFLLKHFFPNTIISFTMLKQIKLGLLLLLVGSLGFLAIEVISHEITPNATCLFVESSMLVPMNVNYYWTVIPQFITSSGIAFASLGFIKFIIAQAPYQMKGLLFAITFWANIALYFTGSYIFQQFSLLSHTQPNCGFYCYLMQTLIILIFLTLFTCLSHAQLQAQAEKQSS